MSTEASSQISDSLVRCRYWNWSVEPEQLPTTQRVVEKAPDILLDVDFKEVISQVKQMDESLSQKLKDLQAQLLLRKDLEQFTKNQLREELKEMTTKNQGLQSRVILLEGILARVGALIPADQIPDEAKKLFCRKAS